MKVEQWTPRHAKEVLADRLEKAKKQRKQYEHRWMQNEHMIFSPQAGLTPAITESYESLAQVINSDLNSGDSDISINYLFKYIRFIHAQMSANPPSVIVKPTSVDYGDRRAAEVADNLVQHGRRQHQIPEVVDLTTLGTLAFGTGVVKTHWDALAGDIDEFDQSTGEITMQGEVSVKPLRIWDFWFDPDARLQPEIKWTFERHVITVEEALFRFPEHSSLINEHKGNFKPQGWDSTDAERRKELFEFYEYTEKRLPWNGLAGRHCLMLEDGTQLTEITANPHPNAELPYHILTDVDIPGEVYGRSFCDYLIRLQDILNRIDSTVLDAIQAHGVVRLVVFDGNIVSDEDEQITNGNWECVQVSGGTTPPQFMQPPQLMTDIPRFRQQLLEGMEALAGVNESMFGQVKREMSGFSLQTAINAGNMVRRRLFNKYTLFVESMYRSYLQLIQVNYTDKRKILVVGEEGALSTAYYSGADIASGYDLQAEYGTSLSLDPASRREEIMQLIPLLKEAGVDLRQVLSLLKLNELDVAYDTLKLAERRQLEIFDEMIARSDNGSLNIYISPKKTEASEDMLPYAKRFQMTAKYKYLPRRVREAIDKHIEEREQLIAERAVPAAPAAGPAPLPPGGMPPGTMPPGGMPLLPG